MSQIIIDFSSAPSRVIFPSPSSFPFSRLFARPLSITFVLCFRSIAAFSFSVAEFSCAYFNLFSIIFLSSATFRDIPVYHL